MNTSRRRFLTGAAATTALMFVPTAAFAGQVLPFPSGNPVTDMVAAANDNVGLARNVGGKLAVAAGQAAAAGTGASMWKRLLGKSPLGRLLLVATLADLGYEIYKAVDGSFTTGTVTAPASTAASNSNGIVVEDSVPFGNFLANIPFGGHAIYSEAGGAYLSAYFRVWIPIVGEGQYGLAGNPIQISTDGGNTWKGFDNSTGRINDWGEQAMFNGKWYARGVISYSLPGVTTFLWRYSPADVEPQKGESGNAVNPDSIPDEAQIPRKQIAKILNDAIADALANDPDLAAQVGQPPVITEEQIDQLFPKNDPLGSVGNARAPLTPPKADPFTGTPPATNPYPNPNNPPSGGGDGGDGTGDGIGGLGLLKPPESIPDIPDAPTGTTVQVDNITVRDGIPICPAIPGFGLAAPITTHCGPIIQNRNTVASMTRLAGYAVVANYILRD